MPAAHGPSIAATSGTTPDISTSSRNRWPEPANSDPAASWIRAPAESSSQTSGIRCCSASSRSRRHLDLAGHPHRAGHHGEVVGGDRAGAAVDLAPAGDHAVGGRVLALHRTLREVRPRVQAHLDERALVHEQVDPLAGRQLPGRVLLGDLLLAAAELRLLAPLVQVVDERLQRPALGRGRLGRLARMLLSQAAPRTRTTNNEQPIPTSPSNSGSRFSKNAVTPSIASSVDSSIVS